MELLELSSMVTIVVKVVRRPGKDDFKAVAVVCVVESSPGVDDGIVKVIFDVVVVVTVVVVVVVTVVVVVVVTVVVVGIGYVDEKGFVVNVSVVVGSDVVVGQSQVEELVEGHHQLIHPLPHLPLPPPSLHQLRPPRNAQQLRLAALQTTR